MRGRTLVEDGRRSVVDEGGAEVDLQGTVTAGRGGAGQRGGTVRVWRTSKGGAQRKKVVKPKECPSLLHGRAVGWVPTVSFGKHVVREVCEGHAGPTACRVSVFICACEIL